MKKKLLNLLLLSLFALTSAFAQSRKITGSVAGADDGLPLPSVSVKITGTNVGTQTNAQGVYTITVPTGAKSLTFSTIGFTNKVVTIGSQITINVKLETDAKALGEVVVTSYGSTKRADVTGAVSTVMGKDIANLPVQTFDKALQGRAAGVQVVTQSGQPGSGITINIRGVATINGSTQPLFVIDGVQVNSTNTSSITTQNSLGDIDPADIESIQIIKDAAEASIYGSQAGNGVVIVTTKKGKAGKTQVRASVQYGTANELNPYHILDANTYYALRLEAIKNYSLATKTSTAANIAGFNSSIQQYIGGTSIPADIPSVDWYNTIFRTAHTQTYDLSLSGGDAKTKFFISGSYQNAQGTIYNSLYKRGTLRANLDNKVSDKFSVESSINMSGILSNGATTSIGFFTNVPFTGTLFTPPFNKVYNADGSYNTAIYPYGENLRQELDLEQRSSATFQTISHLAFNYEPIKGLVARAYAGVEFADARNFDYRPASIQIYASSNGTGLDGYNRNINWNTNGTITYTHTFATDHHLTAVGGVEYKQTNGYVLSASASNFSTPLLTLLSSASTYTAETSTYTGYKLFSYLGQLKYDYKGKYLFSGNIRDDGSSRFGANKKFGLFGGVSVGWKIAQEDFLKNVSWVSDLKLRGSFGITGVQPTSDFQAYNQYQSPSATAGYEGSTVLRQTVLGNADLTWEQSKQIGAGLDFGFFNNRITGSVDVYKKSNTRLILAVPLPASSGFGSISQNIGAADAQGLEIDLNTVNLDLKGFKWNTNFNIAFVKNKLVSLYNGVLELNASKNYQVGQPLNTFWYFQYAGVNPADGRPMYYDKNNHLTYNPVTGDQRNVGDSNPDFYGGFTNTFSYKGITLDVLLQYQYGNEVFLQDQQTLEAEGSGTDNQTTNQLQRWTTPGQITSVPRAYDGFEVLAYDPTNLTTRYIETASYIRLKQVTLNYKLPTSLTKKIGVPGISVFVQAINLATITHYRGQDPETSNGNTLGQYPNAKTITGGITLDL